MNTKIYNSQELHKMSQEQLINKVLHFQDMYRQATNKMLSAPTRLSRMKTKLKKKKFLPVIDFKKCNYRRVALKFFYLGWDLNGLQACRNVDDTVEELLCCAIRQCHLAAEDDPLRMTRCGRTDKGVSAFQQVVTVRLRSRLSFGPGIGKWVDPSKLTVDDRVLQDVATSSDSDETDRCIVVNSQFEHQGGDTMEIGDENVVHSSLQNDESEFDYVSMLNRLLPHEIRILAWLPVVDETFSARHNCIGREYRYFFPRGKLNLDIMNEAAQMLCGEHDFRNFGKFNVRNTVVYVRRINEFQITSSARDSKFPQPYDMCFAKIKGSGFIYHQVRNMMSVLYLIGAGYEQASVILELLDVKKNERKPSYGLTDAYPLVLYKTDYDNLRWRVSKQAFEMILKHTRRTWCENATRSVLSEELLKSIENDETVLVEDTESAGSFTNVKQFIKENDKDSFHDVHSTLKLSGFSKRSKKPYRKIMDLPKGPTLEEKISNYEAKKRRLGLDESDEKLLNTSP